MASRDEAPLGYSVGPRIGGPLWGPGGLLSEVPPGEGEQDGWYSGGVDVEGIALRAMPDGPGAVVTRVPERPVGPNPESAVLHEIDTLLAEGEPIRQPYPKCRCGDEWHGLPLRGCPGSTTAGPIAPPQPVRATHADRVRQKAHTQLLRAHGGYDQLVRAVLASTARLTIWEGTLLPEDVVPRWWRCDDLLAFPRPFLISHSSDGTTLIVGEHEVPLVQDTRRDMKAHKKIGTKPFVDALEIYSVTAPPIGTWTMVEAGRGE